MLELSLTTRHRLGKLSLLIGLGLTGLAVFYGLYFYSWESKKDKIIYSVPMIFMCFLWLKYVIVGASTIPRREHLVDFAILILSAARILMIGSHSGHVLFLVYTFITIPNRTYRLMSIPMLVITAYYKYSWNDWYTPLIALALASILAPVRYFVEKRWI